MATVGDVILNSVHYMLAQDANGKKAWQVQQLFVQPPSRIKSKITFTILAAPQMRDASSAPGVVVTDKDIATVLAALRTATDLTADFAMTGFDDQTYTGLLDQAATNCRSILDETGRITHYEIDIVFWDLYQAP